VADAALSISKRERGKEEGIVYKITSSPNQI
jgi:hypothetical protein